MLLDALNQITLLKQSAEQIGIGIGNKEFDLRAKWDSYIKNKLLLLDNEEQKEEKDLSNKPQINKSINKSFQEDQTASKTGKFSFASKIPKLSGSKNKINLKIKTI